MPPKHVSIPPRPRRPIREAESQQQAEAWIQAPSGRNKRLTIDIPEDLHRQLKAYCASHGLKMADALRQHMESLVARESVVAPVRFSSQILRRIDQAAHQLGVSRSAFVNSS